MALDPVAGAKLGLAAFRFWTRNKIGAKLFPKWAKRRAMKSWRDEHGGPPDEVIEDFNSPDEGSMDIKAFAVQALLATLRHAMTASPFAALVTDDWLLQTATILVGIAGYVWSLKRKVKPA